MTPSLRAGLRISPSIVPLPPGTGALQPQQRQAGLSQNSAAFWKGHPCRSQSTPGCAHCPSALVLPGMSLQPQAVTPGPFVLATICCTDVSRKTWLWKSSATRKQLQLPARCLWLPLLKAKCHPLCIQPTQLPVPPRHSQNARSCRSLWFWHCQKLPWLG